MALGFRIRLPGPGGGGGVLPYISHILRYVPPHWVGFLRRFGLKTSLDFVHFGLKSGMVSRELRNV